MKTQTEQYTLEEKTGKECMDYLMQNKMLTAWRAEDVSALSSLVHKNYSEMLRIAKWMEELISTQEYGKSCFHQAPISKRLAGELRNAIAKAEGR